LRRQERLLGMMTCRLRAARSSAVIEHLVTRTLAEFGSAEEFAESFAAHFRRLREQRPLSKTLCNYYLCLLKLLLYLEEQPPPDTSDMDNDELTDYALETFLRRADCDTPAVIGAFEAAGWQVTPPSNRRG